LDGIGDGKIGMDCSIVPVTRREDSFMISTTDYFYPLIDDPYIQGKIGACNVLSDMYAIGVVDIDNVLMILAASQTMDPQTRKIVSRKMIEGFNDLCKEAGVGCTGGQTVINPWPIIGGTAMSCCKSDEYIYPVNAVPGDVLILTKPLGTQVIVNINEWIQLEDQTKWNKCKAAITIESARAAFETAVSSMIRLNRNAARLMHKYGAHGATDVTGFGIIGHARNFAQNQKAHVDLEIDALPIIKDMEIIDQMFPYFNLVKGFSAETSGGLFIALPAEKAHNFIDELQSLDRAPAWIIGKVLDAKDATKNNAYIAPSVHIIHV